MPDHKFEAGQLVMVRSALGEEWKLRHFSHYDATCEKYGSQFQTIGGGGHLFCIPYNEDTKHLLGTSQDYFPPKPPHEYKWGDKVEVRNADGKWNEAVFINFDPEDFFPFAVMIKGHISLEYFQKENIRPLEPSND